MLQNVPSPKDIQSAADELYVSPRLAAIADHLNRSPELMSWKERRELIEWVFGGKTGDGRKMGVYIRWLDGQEIRRKKKWHYTLRGHVISKLGAYRTGRVPMTKEQLENRFGDDDYESVVTNSASCSRPLLQILLANSYPVGPKPCPRRRKA